MKVHAVTIPLITLLIFVGCSEDNDDNNKQTPPAVKEQKQEPTEKQQQQDDQSTLNEAKNENQNKDDQNNKAANKPTIQPVQPMTSSEKKEQEVPLKEDPQQSEQQNDQQSEQQNDQEIDQESEQGQDSQQNDSMNTPDKTPQSSVQIEDEPQQESQPPMQTQPPQVKAAQAIREEIDKKMISPSTMLALTQIPLDYDLVIERQRSNLKELLFFNTPIELIPFRSTSCELLQNLKLSYGQPYEVEIKSDQTYHYVSLRQLKEAVESVGLAVQNTNISGLAIRIKGSSPPSDSQSLAQQLLLFPTNNGEACPNYAVISKYPAEIDLNQSEDKGGKMFSGYIYLATPVEYYFGGRVDGGQLADLQFHSNNIRSIDRSLDDATIKYYLVPFASADCGQDIASAWIDHEEGIYLGIVQGIQPIDPSKFSAQVSIDKLNNDIIIARRQISSEFSDRIVEGFFIKALKVATKENVPDTMIAHSDPLVLPSQEAQKTCPTAEFMNPEKSIQLTEVSDWWRFQGDITLTSTIKPIN